jgi:hypothetical protein
MIARDTVGCLENGRGSEKSGLGGARGKMSAQDHIEPIRKGDMVALYRRNNPAAGRLAAGYGAIQHTVETQARIFDVAEFPVSRGFRGDGISFFDLLFSLDRVSSAPMWLVFHEIYACKE